MRLIVFACGLASLAVLLVVIILGGMGYPGYDHARQFISELGATGSPVQGSVNAGFVASSVLLIAFWLGVIATLPRTAPLIAGALFGAMNGLGMLVAGIFACTPGVRARTKAYRAPCMT